MNYFLPHRTNPSAAIFFGDILVNSTYFRVFHIVDPAALAALSAMIGYIAGASLIMWGNKV